jgi:uncharacterized membrane protein YfhO
MVLIDRPAISALRVDLGDKPNQKFKIDHLKIFKVRLAKQTSGWDTIEADVEALRRETLKLTRFEDDHILGQINIHETGMLFLGIPFDRGWHAWVNGKRVKITQINIGFMGIWLEEGNNRIELKYVPPNLFVGIFVSFISLMVCLFLYYKKPQINAL